jgi:hypothetical protein
MTYAKWANPVSLLGFWARPISYWAFMDWHVSILGKPMNIYGPYWAELVHLMGYIIGPANINGPAIGF